MNVTIAPLRLNLGSGTDWMGDRVVNIDRRNLVPPDGVRFLRANVADLSGMFEAGSCAEIWARDTLESLSSVRLPSVIQGWARLLRAGGILHLRTRELFPLGQRPGDEVTITFLRGLLMGCGLTVERIGRAPDGRISCEARKA